MENQRLKIGCPVCGSVLIVLNQSGIDKKHVTCPTCKNRSPFIKFRKIDDFSHEIDDCMKHPQEERTQYPGNDPIGSQARPNHTIGLLTIPALGIKFQLCLGENFIGRKGNGSLAKFQIPCATKRTSREHMTIEVKEIEGRGIVHHLSLYKASVNPTFVGSTKLEYGDTIILKNGDLIKFPDGEARFEIPDDEGTEF